MESQAVFSSQNSSQHFFSFWIASLEGGDGEDGVVLPAGILRVSDRGIIVEALRRRVAVGGVVGVEGDEPVLRADVFEGEHLECG